MCNRVIEYAIFSMVVLESFVPVWLAGFWVNLGAQLACEPCKVDCTKSVLDSSFLGSKILLKCE